MTRALVGLFAVAFACSLAVGTRGVAYWDAGDYVCLSLGHGPSGLLLGRPAFLLISRVIVRLLRAAALPDGLAEPTLRWFWSCVSATAAPLLAVLAARLGVARTPALFAGLALAMSPTFAHTSHQVLTDGAALAASLAALITATMPSLRSAALSGALLGVAVATRETAIVHGLAGSLLVYARTGRRGVMCSVGASLAVAGALVLQAHGGSPAAALAWFSAMKRSSSTHGLHPRDVAVSVGWLLAMGPLAVGLGVARLRLLRGELRVVAYPAAAATALLLVYPDGAFSPRYVLATAPIALLLAAAEGLATLGRLTMLTGVAGLAIVFFATAPVRAVARRGSELGRRIEALRGRTTLVPGHYCPHARLALTLARRQDVALVCPGWDWPVDPAATLARELADGRTVAVDTAEEAWIGPRERAPRDAVRAFVATRASRTVEGFTVIDP